MLHRLPVFPKHFTNITVLSIAVPAITIFNLWRAMDLWSDLQQERSAQLAGSIVTPVAFSFGLTPFLSTFKVFCANG
jgi:hypothetical protein